MYWLIAYVMRVRSAGWFVDRRIGMLFPMPVSWQAWALTAALIALLAACILLPSNWGHVIAIVCVVAYLGIGYWTLDER
ncbi:hypothetical protein BH09PSE4_BH09PSE4_16870 [soil metagenome]